MAYNAHVVKLNNVRSHPNADRVKLATVFGNQIVVGINSKEGDLGIYFPCDGQLSERFCRENNLYRKSELNFDTTKKGMFDNNRRVRAQKFRGENSDGFWIDLSTVKLKGASELEDGYEFNQLNGQEICNKYLTQATINAINSAKSIKSIKSAKTSIMFKEHFDTEHFGKHLDKFDYNQLIILTEKCHGTSGRVGHVLIDRELNLTERLLKKLGVNIKEQEWKYISGSRRVVLEETKKSGFHDIGIRQKAFDLFKGNLRKGETVYFEIVGFEPDEKPIMPTVNTDKLNDGEFIKKYGKHMTYSYGCEIGSCDVYVYRMTMTDVDGHSMDYSWHDVIKRCNEIGVKHVPHIKSFSLDMFASRNQFDKIDIEEIRSNLFQYYVESLSKGPSIIDTRHIREGVCVRIEGGSASQTFKYKSFEFKLLEGIVKDSGIIDQEESQG